MMKYYKRQPDTVILCMWRSCDKYLITPHSGLNLENRTKQSMRPFTVKFTWSFLYTKPAFRIMLLRVRHMKLKKYLTLTRVSDEPPPPHYFLLTTATRSTKVHFWSDQNGNTVSRYLPLTGERATGACFRDLSASSDLCLLHTVRTFGRSEDAQFLVFCVGSLWSGCVNNLLSYWHACIPCSVGWPWLHCDEW
jgi:hypothetical protein